MSPPPHPGESAPPLVLDEQALNKLRALDPSGRAGVLQRVLQTYESSLARLMAQFVEARRVGDRPALRHVAHTLYSSSASIGALAFAQSCKAVEQHVRDSDTGDIEPRLDLMADESQRVAAAVRAMLGKPSQSA